jgi:hypothetical protein
MKLLMNRSTIAVLATLFSLNLFAQSFDGYAIYNLQNNKTTYLIDKDGNIAHSWACNLNANYAVALTEDGNLVRGGVYGSNKLNGAAVGGIIQEYDKDANVVWEYIYSNDSHASHHDFCLMPNGNVLLTAWEVKTPAEMTAAGYSGSSTGWPTHIIEVQQDGSGGKIVWEWHIWDHFVQDVDENKDNFGVVKDHPELMDVNALTVGRRGGDWFHVNGLDYNEDLDQIVFSSRFASEIFIIDHSTTTAEAASHAGGNSGKGGDFLYRWGNPSNYGSSDSRQIPGPVHDPRWIKDGRPNEGYIQFFNNTGGGANISYIDAINPTRNGYNYTWDGTGNEPSEKDWRHVCVDNADGQSASDRMTNGNIFVALSKQYMYEADSTGKVVWQYNASPAKAFRYECDHPGIWALLGTDGCGTASSDQVVSNTVTFYPNPSSGIYTITGLELIGDYSIVVTDLLGQELKANIFGSQIDLSNYTRGQYFVRIILSDGQMVSKKLIRN